MWELQPQPLLIVKVARLWKVTSYAPEKVLDFDDSHDDGLVGGDRGDLAFARPTRCPTFVSLRSVSLTCTLCWCLLCVSLL